MFKNPDHPMQIQRSCPLESSILCPPTLMNHSEPVTEAHLTSCFAGALLGTAMGDSVGLPAEGLSRKRVKQLWNGQWRQRLIFGRGMISDDTEHTLFVAQSLLSCSDNATTFQKSLAWKLRLWLLGLPAGIGLGTLRAIIKLWLGFPPHRSGVNSAGNGPAMRSAIIGVFFLMLLKNAAPSSQPPRG